VILVRVPRSFDFKTMTEFNFCLFSTSQILFTQNHSQSINPSQWNLKPKKMADLIVESAAEVIKVLLSLGCQAQLVNSAI
jgi:hypothetical protein